MKYVLGFDIGTGSVKGGLYGTDGVALRVAACPYPTYYAAGGIAEQDPSDWWSAFSRCLASLSLSPDERGGILGIGLSGHSMSVAPIGSDGSPLTDRTPIWSDRRAGAQVDEFFSAVDRNEWYSVTGNGQDPRMYSVAKLMWMRESLPEIYKKADKFVGTKDYINFRLTGRIATDPSYASGCGLYSLPDHGYVPEYLSAAGIDRQKLPDILPSRAVIGHLTKAAASELGLSQDVFVVCGGVDN